MCRLPDVLIKKFLGVNILAKSPKRDTGVSAPCTISATLEVNPEDWKHYKDWSESDHQKFFVDMIEYESIVLSKILLEKRWSIVFTEIDQFITTDKPVAIEHQTKSIFGFRTPGTIVSFPISQRSLLVMDDMHSEPANQYYPLKEGALGAFNFGIWHNGSRFMISGRSIPEVLHEIISWADTYESSYT